MQFTKFMIPAVALGFLAAMPTLAVRADDAPNTAPTTAPTTTQPATQPVALGKVTIKVVDTDGNPVPKAKVQIVQAHKKGDGQTDDKHAGPVAHGVTDAQGAVTLAGIPLGTYRANAVLKGSGKGSEKVSISLDAAATITITLNADRAKTGT